jgi:cysteinyl-tRNA synthetase
MSLKYLGEYFDIHTGGVDHIPIHHTSEIRQMEAAVGHKVVNYWIHGAWLSFGESEKMSKSEGDTILLDNIIEKQINPIAYRYLVLTAHYRNPLKFTWDSLVQAQTALRNLKSRISSLSIKKTDKINLNYINKFKEVISNDLDTPKALSLLWQLIKDPKVSDNEKYNTSKIFDEVLGIDLLDYRNMNNEIEISTEILSILQQREESRKNKDYATSDKLRDILEEKGYKIKDGKDSLYIQET